MRLYSFFRSSAAYRVRIALNLKGLPHEYEAINLLRDEGDQHEPEYTALNPQKLVPTLVDGSLILSQSMAIIEYLDEAYPETPALLPPTTMERAKARELALLIGCDIHPLNNLRVLKYLARDLAVDRALRNQWYAHWIQTGFDAFEQMVEKTSGEFCIGDAPGIADCFLIPQVVNAQSFKVDISTYKHISRIFERCQALPAFMEAAPANQPDAS